MFDFASVQIQKLSYTYLDDVKDLAANRVKDYITANTLYSDEKADAIFNRNDFKNILKKSCAAFQIQFADALTFQCEDLAAKGLNVIVGKAQYLSFYNLHQGSQLMPQMNLTLEGAVYDPMLSYFSEMDHILDSLAQVIQIQYKITKALQINKFVSEIDQYLEKFDLARINAKKDSREINIEEYYRSAQAMRGRRDNYNTDNLITQS